MNVLVIDDQKSICYSLKRLLEKNNMNVTLAYDGQTGMDIFSKDRFDIVFLDVKLPDIDGIDLLENFFPKVNHNAKIIIMTAFHETDIALKSMKIGAFEYILKPFDSEQLNEIISNILRGYNKENQDIYLCVKNDPNCKEKLISGSSHMLDVIKKIGKVSKTSDSVLITGETGTGKEIVARAIHNYSSRSKGPFIAINCSAIPQELLESELFGYEKGAFTGAVKDYTGKIEYANGGTVFLDEIGDMPLLLQSKILRLLQDREIIRIGSNETKSIDVRFIAATNRDIHQLMLDGSFRKDLYYRLNTYEINLKPLRERKDDIIPLCKYFLGKYTTKEVRITDKALEKLLSYDYPGNIRELENVIKRAVLESPDVIDEKDLFFWESKVKPSGLLESIFEHYKKNLDIKDLNSFIEEIETFIVKNCYEMFDRNQVLTAEKLGISRNKLRKLLGID
ncbi:MAG: sigma-54 dependent transcriptional regulator [Calditerrivibrio sp.]|nr:sigma-54 dependent transcriptional regulator [Calditerrivibrio sp.]MCA1981082.1 sigma-54 dependent transcriptional regulator [Calditerrivibrio sp.]